MPATAKRPDPWREARDKAVRHVDAMLLAVRDGEVPAGAHRGVWVPLPDGREVMIMVRAPSRASPMPAPPADATR